MLVGLERVRVRRLRSGRARRPAGPRQVGEVDRLLAVRVQVHEVELGLQAVNVERHAPLRRVAAHAVQPGCQPGRVELELHEGRARVGRQPGAGVRVAVRGARVLRVGLRVAHRQPEPRRDAQLGVRDDLAVVGRPPGRVFRQPHEVGHRVARVSRGRDELHARLVMADVVAVVLETAAAAVAQLGRRPPALRLLGAARVHARGPVGGGERLEPRAPAVAVHVTQFPRSHARPGRRGDVRRRRAGRPDRQAHQRERRRRGQRPGPAALSRHNSHTYSPARTPRDEARHVRSGGLARGARRADMGAS